MRKLFAAAATASRPGLQTELSIWGTPNSSDALVERRELVAETGGHARRRYIRGTFAVNFGREGEQSRGRRRAPRGRGPRRPRCTLRALADRPRLRRHRAVLREIRRAARALGEHDHRRVEEGTQTVRRLRREGDTAARREPRRAAADGSREALVRLGG